MNVGSAACFDQKARHTLHVRREPFEYGLLPLPTLIFSDSLRRLQALRSKLLSGDHINVTLTPEGDALLDCASIAIALDLFKDEAQLVMETLASVLPSIRFSSPSSAGGTYITSVSDLILFLYMQNYKKPPIRPHKDAAAVADVWPSTSAFDSFLSNLTPLQVRTGGRKSLPLQVDEEAYQLAYVQKHLPALLSLLAHTLPDDEESERQQVLSLEKFNHLGLLLQCRERYSEVVPLSQAAPFFANSDPDMPAAPVPLLQVLEWILKHLSDCPQERARDSALEGEVDVTMLDAGLTTAVLRGSPSPGVLNHCKDGFCEGTALVDGITKVSVVKNENDIYGGSVRVSNCHDCVIYILAPLKYATVYGCSDSIIVLGAVERAVRIEHCERVQFIVASMRIHIANCRECLFNLAVNQRPLIMGENHNLQVAPYNTFYPKLEAHVAEACLDLAVNKWDKFLTLGVVDPHNPLLQAAGVADTPAEGASLLPPDRFTNFVIPKWNESESPQQPSTKSNPFILPKAYLVSQQQRNKAVDALKQTLKNAQIDAGGRQDLSQAIHVHFREWLYASGYFRQMYEFQDSNTD